MRFRRNIADTAFNAAAYCEAIAAAQARSDDYGYEYLSGIHGYPLPIFCPHASDIFLPWHRAYLMQFEICVGQNFSDFAIGVWDWRTPAGTQGQIPELFTSISHTNSDALLRYAPSRLRATELDELVRGRALDPAAPHSTLRNPSKLPLPIPREVSRPLNESNFFLFQRSLESGVHNLVHDWVGGAMGSVPSAAFDPIFWSHHAMIDAIWAAWEDKNPRYPYPASYLASPLPPFNLRVGDVVTMRNLAYQYDLVSLIS
jgi:tyrosinase